LAARRSTSTAAERPPAYQPRLRKSRPGTWTDERIVASLSDWFDRFGETPRSYEWSGQGADLLGLPRGRRAEWARLYPRWPSTATVCRHFGTWAGAVDAAGLPPARSIAPGRGRAERVEDARRLRAHGVATAEIAALLEVSPRTVRNYLSAGVCRDCGTPAITSDRCPRCAARHATRPHWTRAQVLRAFRAWVREEGRVPTTLDWTPTGDLTRRWAREYPRWPGYVSVNTLFGSWRGGVEAAGLRPRRRSWDRESILAALREFAAAANDGRPPAAADLDRHDQLPSPGTVRAHLGSLQAALEAAGLRAGRRRWSEDLIVRAMVRHARAHGGRLPTAGQWDRATSEHPHATTVLQRFGSWSAATARARAHLRRR
jgi:hypothetical protein